MTTLHASCLCGDVRWEGDGPIPAPDPKDQGPMALLTMSHCHCSRCRKAHGAPYATYLVVPEKSFRIVQGAASIVRWPSSAAMFRPFCRRCGSVVPDGVPWNGVVGTPVGPFDDDPGVRARSHIFVGSKAPWVTIDDDLPRFDAYPDALGMASMSTRAPLDPDGGKPRGSCLCGDVAYVVSGPVVRSRTCHCSRCRKAGSAGRMTYLTTPYGGVDFTRGEDLVATYKVPEARFFKQAFCRICGSPMPRKDADRGLTFVPMGSLDDDPGVRPSAHIYVGSIAPWDPILDALPTFDENAPS